MRMLASLALPSHSVGGAQSPASMDVCKAGNKGTGWEPTTGTLTGDDGTQIGCGGGQKSAMFLGILKGFLELWTCGCKV